MTAEALAPISPDVTGAANEPVDPPSHAELAALRARLDASEKTVKVLKRKVHALLSGAEKSIIEKQLVQAQRRSEAAAKKRELMELRAAELERYSAQLEGDVRERTRTIRTILDHVTFGFLLVDAELRIQPGYTESCHALFGEGDLAGRVLHEVLGLPEREAEEWLLGIGQVFDDFLPESVNVGQLRTRFPVGSRVLRVEGRVVRDEAGAVGHLLLSVTDISAQEQAELDARRAKALVEILRQREPFRNFVRDARQRLDVAIESGDPSVVRGAVHTIKGNAACFGLFEVASIAHEVEDLGVERGRIDEGGVRRVEDALKTYLLANASVLGIDLDDRGDPGAVLSPNQLKRLVELAKLGSAELQSLVESLTRRPAAELLGPLERLVERLSLQLGKDVRFDLEGGETLVDAALQDVFGVLGHLVRNAIDHGITDAGHIGISVEELDGRWVIRVRDDGRGIDADAVARKAVARSLVGEEELAAMTDSQKLQLIFVDGLSTAETTTDISGRGVGMGAVLEAVGKAGGTLHVDSALGHGTTVEVRLPKREATRHA